MKIKYFCFQVTKKKQTNDYLLHHLLNSVNKLIQQHAVDISKLEMKLQIQQEAINKLGQSEDITILLHKVKEQQGDITKMKVQHAVDVTKLRNNQRGQQEETLKLKTKHTLDLINMVHNLQKQKKDMDKLKNQTAKTVKKDISRAEAKHAKDMQKLKNSIQQMENNFLFNSSDGQRLNGSKYINYLYHCVTAYLKNGLYKQGTKRLISRNTVTHLPTGSFAV